MAASSKEVLSLEEPSASSDLILIVEGRKLYVHKAVLGLYSPVFERMFSSDFAEKDAKEIELPDKKYDSLLRFLRQMYPVTSLEPITDDRMESLLKLADEYQVSHVFQKCKDNIKNYLTLPKEKQTTDQTLFYLWMSQLYGPISEFRKTFVSLARDLTTAQLQNSRRFQSVPALTMKDVTLERSKLLEAQLKREQESKNRTRREIESLQQRVEVFTDKPCDPYCTSNSLCKDCLRKKVVAKLEKFASDLS